MVGMLRKLSTAERAVVDGMIVVGNVLVSFAELLSDAWNAFMTSPVREPRPPLAEFEPDATIAFTDVVL